MMIPIAELNLHWECSFITVNATVAQGYVFTGICHSVHGGEHVSQHALDRHTPVRQPQSDTPRADTPLWADTPTGADIPTGQASPGQAPPPSVCWDAPPTQCMLVYTPRRPLQRTVRILLECILVLFVI